MLEHLSALQVAEAVARLGSMRAAADELNVTPGAISQQINKLEARLGRKLFERRSRGIVPTELGERIAVHLSLGFQEIRRGLALIHERDDNVISISVAPVFAGRWLVWRLHRFSEAFPGARVQVEATVEIVDPAMAGIDACIRVGRGEWPGVRATQLIEHRVFPVCAPELARCIRQPADLAHVPIIRDTRSMFDWDTWLRPNNMSKNVLGDGPLFSDSSIGLDAAIAGQGVLLAWETLATDAISSGRLVAPLPGRFKSGLSYWFVEPEGTRRRAVVAAFRKWLVTELSAFST
ncbi:LysR family transcriptional regulator [Tabrizicola sp. TH137]|uniref:LysR substrate-binding domain-containing protein n=1 Tax=Tabrizicola sp. TH137 TaxID=2067452 RepID=UPI000C7ABACE|nr:LysR family transcriptional regulator [Tabrizicola sp. TH137]